MFRYLAFFLVALSLILLWWFFEQAPQDENNNATAPLSTLAKDQKNRVTPPRPRPFPKIITLLPVAASADSLHSPDTTAEEDLSIIHSLLRSHRRALGTNPVGLNDEITAALTGHNAKGAASLPRNHPAISEKGELLDRWKTPYRFHAFSGKLMEIRSAGPDRKFFTSDDALLRE